MSIARADRDTLRQLASRVAEAAALPVQQQRAALVKDLNELHPRRPVVLAFPEGGWRDLVPDDTLRCSDPLLRQWEQTLRGTVFRHEHIGDDYPITADFNLRPVVDIGDFGLRETRHKTEEQGSYHWDPPVKTPQDFARLHVRSVTVRHDETARREDLARDILGDILNVRSHSMLWWSAGLTQDLVFLRGLEQMMFDMYDQPQLVHDMMTLLRDDMIHLAEVCQTEGVLALNNGPNDYVGSGGLGHTDELPAGDFDGSVRLKDMWVLGESQETVGVGPEQFEEFVLGYQKPILDRFGLVCYGCCEPLDKRFDLLTRALPNLRRLSISPWCNRELAAEKLGRRYVFSWKPNPALICAPAVDWDEVRRVTRETVRIAGRCCLEMIMKDTHTFAGDPTRIGRWVRIALEAAQDT